VAKSWQRESASRVRLSTYNEAVLSKRAVLLIVGNRVTHLTDREMDRLAEEWVDFRAGPGDGTDPPPPERPAAPTHRT
jgi:hypothetical protein